MLELRTLATGLMSCHAKCSVVGQRLETVVVKKSEARDGEPQISVARIEGRGVDYLIIQPASRLDRSLAEDQTHDPESYLDATPVIDETSSSNTTRIQREQKVLLCDTN